MAQQHPRPAMRTVQRIRSGDSYVLVFGLIVADYLVLSLSTSSQPGWNVAAVLVTGATLVSALRTSRTNAVVMRVALASALAALLLAAVNTVVNSTKVSGAVAIVIGGLLLAAPVAILGRIARHPTVTIETVAGAVDVYLLLGLTFASIYAAVSSLAPPFFAQGGHPAGNDFVYFSYVTLATLGYGDLTPAGSLGRTLAVMEALVGQVYLVTVVARLVAGMVTTRR